MEIPFGSRVEYRVLGIESTGVFGEVFGKWFTAALMFRSVEPCSYKVRWDDGRVDEHVKPSDIVEVRE